jgi:hypothetical protein
MYETHTHTREGSACASWSAIESVRAHKEAGFTGIIVTNHFYYGNTSVDRRLPWKEWAAAFCSGYRIAKEEGDRVGLQVFFGWEAGYQGTEFLIYGLDEQWLLSHPEIKDATVEEQYRLVKKSGGMVVQAHPFRKEAYIPEIRLYPDYVDAVEAVNTCHSCPKSDSHYNPGCNARAIAYAGENNLPMTSGSDTHRIPLLDGGMLFGRKLIDIHDFIKAVLNKEPYKLLTGIPGETIPCNMGCHCENQGAS